jgi:Putative zinc-finger
MRCDDCLRLIEEYFDDETDARTSGQMAAHLSACEDCSAALDALSFEQETYARYDRELEVSPALWARVNAEIARADAPETRAENRSFLSRARESFVAALSSLSARPALASSLALLLMGVTAGSLWLAHVGTRSPDTVVSNVTPARGTVAPASHGPANVAGGETKEDAGARAFNGGVVPAGDHVVGSGSVAEPRASVAPRAEPRPENVESLLADSGSAQQGYKVIDGFKSDERETRLEDSPTYVKVGGEDVAVVTADERPLDPEQKEVARHVERAQVLLRSIKNARAEGGDTFNVSYEKKLSRKLLGENTILQLDAETRGDKDTKQVLDRIEPYLLDIANMPERASPAEVRSIRERIDSKEIIAALQVY